MQASRAPISSPAKGSWRAFNSFLGMNFNTTPMIWELFWAKARALILGM